MLDRILQSLNSDQILPVKDTEGAVLVIAGAGSGKTRVLTSRIAYLVLGKGVPCYRIAAITFTNKAANEMRERLDKLGVDVNELWVSTIHSLCVRILRARIQKIGYGDNFTIYDEGDKDRVLKRIVAEVDPEDEKLLKQAKTHISNAKNAYMDPDEYEEAHGEVRSIRLVCEVYRRYEAELLHSNALDFDDILVKTYRLLTEDAETLEYYADKFRYIHVDEFQDTNRIQYLIIKRLASKHKNLFVVGDDDQSIYGWRGAEIKNILHFEDDFEGAKVYKLEQNYRSTQKILDLANTVISNNVGRRKKELWTKNEDGVKVESFIGSDENNEATFAALQIKSLMARNGYRPQHFAVLMRVNAISRAFEQEFTKYGIPFRVFGGFKFFERKEIKDVLAYMKLLNNPLDDESLLRIINYPKRGIGDRTVDLLREYARGYGLSVFDAVIEVESIPMPAGAKAKVVAFRDLMRDLIIKKEVLAPADIFDLILEKTGFMELFEDGSEENLSKKMNIGELKNSIVSFCYENKGATLSDYLNSVTLSSDIDDINTEDCVTIATIHAVKGLEFRCVFIVGLDESIFPISRAADELEELEEERRLMYVAITRARERLYLTRAKSRYLYGERSFMMQSRFLKELEHKLNPDKPREREKEFSRPAYGDPDYGSSDANGTGFSTQYANTFMKQSKPVKNEGVDVGRFVAGAKVEHVRFGVGTIVFVKGSGANTVVDVAFKGVGIKSLSVQFAPMKIVE